MVATAAKTSKTVVGTKHINWLALILGGWVLLLGLSFYERLKPASDWLEIQSLHIEDTTVGADLIINYERDIKQEFTGHWIAELQIQNASGKWTATCVAAGSANYSPDKEPPDPITLTWWTGPTDCTPSKPGNYRLSTTWHINQVGSKLSPEYNLFKRTSAISNTFRVTVP